MRVNQIGITIYDNKPTLPANRWYENTKNKETTTNRYKIELNFLHQGAPIKLRSSLAWPPSQLRRLSYWKDNLNFYEQIVTQANAINDQIRSGLIPAHTPALIAIPNENQKYQTPDKRTQFKWQMPQLPSAIIATRRMISPEFYQWHLQWIGRDHKHEFILNTDSRADSVPSRTGVSTRVYKAIPGPHEINDGLITIDYNKPTYIVEPLEDAAYLEFKRRISYFFTKNHDEEALNLLKQFPEYTDRWSKE
jgi:hypothetical protein